jgi:hypothetical protein
MISIRTEAYAPLRIDNVDITVIKQLEISIFPCTNYVLRLQITKSLADLLHKYFSIGRLEAYEDAYSSSTIHEVSPSSSSLTSKSAVSTPSSPTKLSASNLTTTSVIVSSSSAGELSTSSLALDNKSEGGTSSGGSGAIMTKRSSIFSVFSSNKESPSSTSSTSSLKKTFGGKSKKKKKESSESDSSDHAGSTPRGNRAISMLSGTSDSQSEQLVKSSSRKSQPFLSGNKGPSGGSGGGGGGAVDISQKPVLAKKRQEGLYIVYLRVGDINVDVSTAGFGFALNLDRFQAIMDKYFCKKQVLNWKRLIWEVEKHLVTSLIKNTASSSFTKLFSSLTHRGSMIGKQPLALTTSGGGSSTASHFLNPSGLTSSSSSSISGHHGTTGSAASAPSIDPEVLLTSKKNLLLGGRMVKAKPRTSSIAVLAKRPTLYASPSSFPSGASSSKNSQDDDLGDVHDIQPFPSSSAVSSSSNRSSERDEERRPPAVVHPSSTFNFLNPRASTSNSNSGTPTSKEGTGKEGKKRISTLPSLFHSPFSSISSPSAGHSHEQKLQTGANVNTSEPASASGSQGQTPASGGSSSSNKKFLGLF